MTAARVPDDVRAALDAYRADRTPANWTSLSQMSIGESDVLDALQAIKPDFPDPLPLPVEDLTEDNNDFYQWETLPSPDDVERAVDHALKQRR